MLGRLRWWVRGRFRRGRVLEEIEDDIRTHIELEAERLRSEGIAPSEALRRANARFGDRERIGSEMRAVALGAGVDARRSGTGSLALHLRHAARSLRATPGATALVVIMLSAAVAVHALTLSVAQAVLFGDGGVADASRIMTVYAFYPQLREGMREQPIHPRLVERFEQLKGVQDFAAFKAGYFNLTGVGRPRRLSGMLTTPRLFDVAGVRPMLGPGFVDVTRGDERVVVLSWHVWRNLLGGDPSRLGTTVELNGEPYEVVGVMPPGFRFPRGEDVPPTFQFPERPDVWVPYPLPQGGPSDLGGVARLEPGTSPQLFQRRLDALAEALRKEFGGGDSPLTLTFRAASIRDQAVGKVRPGIEFLVLATLLVLLVAMGNVTGVGVVRREVRSRELAVRMALGAGRRGAVGLLAAESAILAVVTAVLATGWALGLAAAVRRAAPHGMPGIDQVHITAPILAVVALLSIVGASCLALGPALGLGRVRLADVLHGARALGSRGSRRGVRAIVSLELAGTLVLLTTAIVLARSVLGLLAVDPGFDARGVLTAEVTLPEASYPDSARARAVQRAQKDTGPEPAVARFQRTLIQRLRRKPEIVDAAFANPLPFAGGQEASVFWIEGMEPPKTVPLAEYTVVTEGYFSTMGIPVLKGRTFTSRDRHDSEPVVVVSASLAAQFPGGRALGGRLKLGGAADSPYPWLTVVGVVGDVKRTDLTGPARPEMYVHVSQGGYSPQSTSRLVVRVAEGVRPASVAPTVRAAVSALDPDVPLESVGPLSDLLAGATARVGFLARLIFGFSVLALLITALGLYSVTSHAVNVRRREMALRVAVGASGPEVVRLAMTEAVIALAVGLGVGGVGVYLSGALLKGWVYGLRPLEPWSLAASAAILVATVALAALGPARRCLRIDPARLLTQD